MWFLAFSIFVFITNLDLFCHEGHTNSDVSHQLLLFHRTGLARFAFGHNKHLKSVAASCWKSQPSSGLSTLPLAHVSSTSSGYTSPNPYMPQGGIVTSQIAPLLRIGSDTSTVRDGRVSTSGPLATVGIMHGSPLSDNSSQHSDSGASNDAVSNGIMNLARAQPFDNSFYLECIFAMCALAKDSSPRVSRLGRRVLSIIGIEQVVAKPLRHSSAIGRPSEPSSSGGPRVSGISRSSSWFDMNGGMLN